MANSLELALTESPRLVRPEFFLGVLDHLPTPILVVGRLGIITYANAALTDLLGYAPPQGAGSTVFDIVHASDRDWLLETFADRRNPARARRVKPPSIRVRLLSSTGAPIAVEINPAPPGSDAAVGGVIVEVRTAQNDDILGEILSGVSGGAEQSDLLSLLARFVAMQPLDVDAAVLQRRGGRWRVLSSTATHLGELLEQMEPTEFSKMVGRPQCIEVDAIDGDLGRGLRDASYNTLWRLSVDSELIDDDSILRFEIIAVSELEVLIAPAIAERLNRARELARLIMKAMNDRRLLTAADFDELTGVLTRAALNTRIEAIPRHGPTSNANSLVFLDLDGFKPVNDTYGHAAGDAVLKVVAERISKAVRGNDVVARIGGDEFVVLLLDTDHDPNVQQMIADRIVGAIKQPIRLPETDVLVSVSASAGFAVGCPDEPMEDVMARADKLMYQAKSLGGGAVVFQGCVKDIGANAAIDVAAIEASVALDVLT